MRSIPSTISGVTFSQAKRIAKAEFEADMIKIIQNIESHSYDVYVLEPVDKKKAEKFKRCWSNAFKIIPVQVGKSI